MNSRRQGIVRFKNEQEAIAQGYTLPDKSKDTDISPYPTQDMGIKWQNLVGQISVPVWLDEDAKVIQMYRPK